MKNILWYLNPIVHLGDKKYSSLFPFITTIVCTALIECYFNVILKQPESVGLAAIFIYIALIIYFSFREGIRGGIITSIITILYYIYIIHTRHYTGAQFKSGVNTTVILGLLYFLLSVVIGWLKETIDSLIEREANEKKRLHTVIQQLPVGVVITDNTGKVLQANKKIHEIVGLKVPIGFKFGEKKLIDFKAVGKDHVPEIEPINQTLTTGISINGKEYTMKRKDGKIKHLQVNTAIIHNRSGEVIAVAAIINDITQQKEMEERKDDFVNMASHELKTPITSIKLFIDVLQRHLQKVNDAQGTKILENINKQTERLQTLVNDLLDVSRLQTGKLTFTKEIFRIDELIEEIIATIQSTIKKQVLTFAEKHKISVYADRFRIYQVLTNLIDNAAKYSKEGKEIIVRLSKKDTNAIVSVQDFGIGIAQDQQKKIFERLYQVNDIKEKTFPGFGMGLYISKEIINRHNGSIWVDSEKNKGSIFYFTLPSRKI